MKYIKYALFLCVMLIALVGCSNDDKAEGDHEERSKGWRFESSSTF